MQYDFIAAAEPYLPEEWAVTNEALRAPEKHSEGLASVRDSRSSYQAEEEDIVPVGGILAILFFLFGGGLWGGA